MEKRAQLNLQQFEQRLRTLWSLGSNIVLAWAPASKAIKLLVIPHYALKPLSTDQLDGGIDSKSSPYGAINTLISGRRELGSEALDQLGSQLSAETITIDLPFELTGSCAETAQIEQLVKRFSISFSANRAVFLLDIVGFGLLSPFDQVVQLNSLAFSLNSANAKMLDQYIELDFARSTIGDGFYVWNRDSGLNASINLFHFMNIALAENAIAQQKGKPGSVPVLRASFNVGRCYEYHQAEGLAPTERDFIVGDVTIELARMIDAAKPGQILVGDFLADFESSPSNVINDSDQATGAVNFLAYAQHSLGRLSGLVLSGEQISGIRCYLTGEPQGDGSFLNRKLTIVDKHRQTHSAFNAKVNIYRHQHSPILLGIQDKDL